VTGTRAAAVALASALVATALVANALAATTPVVHSLTPAPAAVVPAGDTAIEAWLRSSVAIRSAEVTVDGQPVLTATTGEPDPQLGTPVRASVSVEVGGHTIAVRTEDRDGNVGNRSWEVVASGTVITRLAGEDRFATAVAISRASYPEDGSADGAVLARADDFADALAGAPLAVVSGGPLLLARSDELPEPTADELLRALPLGATVHLLGGPAALSAAVEQAVRELGFVPRRHEGDDRYATAAEVAAALPPGAHAFVVSGQTYPDALAASVPAARSGSPVLLTASHHLPDATVRSLREREVTAVTIVGGPAAVSPEVEHALSELVGTVDRVAGADRYATAAAVAARYLEDAATVALAAGHDFADALAGAPYLAELGAPLLLSPPHGLAPATTDVLRGLRPGRASVLGGPAVLPAHVEAAVVAATTDGAGAPHLNGTVPGPAADVAYLDRIHIAVDADLDLSRSSAYVAIDGVETPVQPATEGQRILVVAVPGAREVAPDLAHEVRVVVAVAGAGSGELVRRSWTFRYVRPDPHFGNAGPVPLYLPADDVELIGFHQSSHDGAQQIAPRDTATTMTAMEDRDRGTGLRTAADIVANPELPVYAPTTGTVIRAGTYRLYCDHFDHYLVIEPDAAPGWEVKILHFEGLAVSSGDRVVARTTRVGSAPRTLPFESQVDEYSEPRNWPHLHVEVVDPSIPDRPGPGC